MPSKLDRILNFTGMLDAFRLVERVIYVNGADRMENDSEHSYNLAMLAWYIADAEALDMDKDLILRYALVHDIAEVYAGDTYIYSTDEALLESKSERERAALLRLEGEFPDFPDMVALAHRYERREDRESRFVYALDKLEPVLHILLDHRAIWKEKGITLERLLESKRDKIALSPEIEPYFDELVSLLTQEEGRLFAEKSTEKE